MAEFLGLTASIIQIAGAGAKLSVSLYNFVGSVARADQDIADIAGDVELTANALNSVGKVFEDKSVQSIISKGAIQDANNLINRCEAVFGEISKIMDKRRKTYKGTTSLSTMGKLSWPLKEPKVELHRRRLEGLKNSLMLLLHVLQLASGQTKRQLENSAIEEEYEKIRRLHQLQQESLQKLQLFERKLNTASTVGHEDPQHSDSLLGISTHGSISVSSPLENLGSSDSDDAMMDQDEGHLTVDELTQCTQHVQKLLKKISRFEHTFRAASPRSLCPRSRVYKAYRSFCDNFELEIMPKNSGINIILNPFGPYHQGDTLQISVPTIRVTETEGQFDQSYANFTPFTIIDHTETSPPSVLPMNIEFSENPTQVLQFSSEQERVPSRNQNSDIPTPILSNSFSVPPSCAYYSPQDRDDGNDSGSVRRYHSYKRSEEPTRNEEGKMICKHQECSDITFDRKAEWSKHMDKHDRPYKCLIDGCEKLQGFTYSGGLLRHEREIHKMHGGTKKFLFCPFMDCKRSLGSGFTRKQNLAEHIRRVHRTKNVSENMNDLIIGQDSPKASSVEKSSLSASPHTHSSEFCQGDENLLKRKHHFDRGDEEPHSEIKRLRHENELKDAQLRQLEDAVIALQQRHTNTWLQESHGTTPPLESTRESSHFTGIKQTQRGNNEDTQSPAPNRKNAGIDSNDPLETRISPEQMRKGSSVWPDELNRRTNKGKDEEESGEGEEIVNILLGKWTVIASK